jgi:hypothetical protein
MNRKAFIRGGTAAILTAVPGHPAVTCVVPGTGKPEPMRDNVQAGFGAIPDQTLRQGMAALLDS